ncbi:hypothetical protein M1O16_05120 [Dehalococcoidia bacterium]|nr:hypothetical protein [Dehalococcoidia bacterium]
MTHLDHFAHSFGSSVECKMSQETTDEAGYLVLTYSQADRTIVGMAKATMVETQVTSEKGHRPYLMQERDDFLVFHPSSANFMTDLANLDPPATQKLPLAVWDVLIQHVHELAIAGTNSGA